MNTQCWKHLNVCDYGWKFWKDPQQTSHADDLSDGIKEGACEREREREHSRLFLKCPHPTFVTRERFRYTQKRNHLDLSEVLPSLPWGNGGAGSSASAVLFFPGRVGGRESPPLSKWPARLPATVPSCRRAQKLRRAPLESGGRYPREDQRLCSEDPW